MSQSDPESATIQKQHIPKITATQTNEDQNQPTPHTDQDLLSNQKQVKETKTSNQFVYYVPHETEEPPKTNNIEQVKKRNSSGSEKSQSRSRSRDKKNHNKEYKNEHDEYYNKSEKYPRGEQRPYRNYQQGDRFKRQQMFKDDAYKKTKMCPQFERGQCRKGEDCNFAHSDLQLRGLPDFKKTKLCIAFKEGKCGKLSSECKYAHGEAQLKKVPRQSADREDKQGRYSDARRNKYNNNYAPNYHQNQPHHFSYQMPPPAYMPYPPMYSNPYMPPVPPSTSNQPLPINPNEFTSNQRSMISYPNNTGSNRGYGEYVHQPGSTVGYEYGSGNYPPLPYGYYPPPFSSTLPPPPSPYGYQQPKPPI